MSAVESRTPPAWLPRPPLQLPSVATPNQSLAGWSLFCGAVAAGMTPAPANLVRLIALWLVVVVLVLPAATGGDLAKREIEPVMLGSGSGEPGRRRRLRRLGPGATLTPEAYSWLVSLLLIGLLTQLAAPGLMLLFLATILAGQLWSRYAGAQHLSWLASPLFLIALPGLAAWWAFGGPIAVPPPVAVAERTAGELAWWLAANWAWPAAIGAFVFLAWVRRSRRLGGGAEPGQRDALFGADRRRLAFSLTYALLALIAAWHNHALALTIVAFSALTGWIGPVTVDDEGRAPGPDLGAMASLLAVAVALR